MRLFEMFMGPLEEMKPWSTRGVEGVHRFLNRVWRLFVTEVGTLEPSILDVPPSPDFERLYHQTVQKVGEDIENLRFNTAIAQLMIFVNEAMKLNEKPRQLLEQFVLLLSPFAPHLAEELWQRLGHTNTLAYEPWPTYDPAKTIEETVEVVFQVNGKVRSKVHVALNTDEQQLEQMALNDTHVKRHVDGKRIARTIVVKNKLVNFVVTPN
jgi:leucyl-tRNA synthetase